MRVSDRPELDEVAWNEAVDRAVILMSLLITRALFRRFKASSHIRGRVLHRLDTLIVRYKETHGQAS